MPEVNQNQIDGATATINTKQMDGATPTINTKQIGSVYKHVTDAILKYYPSYTTFGVTTRLWRYDATKRYLYQAMKSEYEADKTYPVHWFEYMADLALKWCESQYSGLLEEDVIPVFQAAWKFHKKWLLYIQGSGDTDGVTKLMMDEIAAILKETDDYHEVRKKMLTDLYCAIEFDVLERRAGKLNQV